MTRQLLARPLRRSRRREDGSVLVVVLLISILVLVLGLSISFLVVSELRNSAFDRNHRSALYIAEQGLREAEAALANSFRFNGWQDDINALGLGRPENEADAPPLGMLDRSLERPGWIVYRWTGPGEAEAVLNKVPLEVQGGNARYTVWIRNNTDDYGAGISVDADDSVLIISLGELLDLNGAVKARSYLSETLAMLAPVPVNYGQEGEGSGGFSVIEE